MLISVELESDDQDTKKINEEIRFVRVKYIFFSIRLSRWCERACARSRLKLFMFTSQLDGLVNKHTYPF